MANKIIMLVFMLIGGSLGYNYLPEILLYFEQAPAWMTQPWVGTIIGIIFGWVIGLFLVRPFQDLVNKFLDFSRKQNVTYLLFGSFGLIVGLIISWLINVSLVAFSFPVLSDIVPVIVTVILAYIGFHIGSTRREEIRRLFLSRNQTYDDDVMAQKEDEAYRKYKVIDTSSIIDGRILEVIRTGFLEGVFVVSHYVLQELQHIADSSDSIKRVRGRRGLDILNALQKEEDIQVEMSDRSLSEVEEVDMKLVHLAKELGGSVVTNDYNLNKVAEFQHVPVLNINELANVVKPVVIPGESMRAMIVKSGTEREQGVAYLDDGTMVVVEDGKHYINEMIEVIVTSSLQTNAGRMIFAKLSDDQKAIGD